MKRELTPADTAAVRHSLRNEVGRLDRILGCEIANSNADARALYEDLRKQMNNAREKFELIGAGGALIEPFQ